MKLIIKLSLCTLFAGMLLSAVIIIGVSSSYAGAKVIAIEGAGFSVEKSMADNIAGFKGKTVTVILGTGETVTGKVVDVNSRYLHLSDLERTNFMDAFIDVSKISAVKAQVRKFAND